LPPNDSKNARQLLEAVALETGGEGIALSVLTVLELVHGISRADTSERRDRRQHFVDDLLTGVPVQISDGADCFARRLDRR
jgi:predicted nucleic acid-binding protein